MSLSVRGVVAPGEDRTPIVLAHGAANSACVWTFWAGGAGSAWLVLLGPCSSNTSPGGRRMPRNVTSFSRSMNKRSGTACGHQTPGDQLPSAPQRVSREFVQHWPGDSSKPSGS